MKGCVNTQYGYMVRVAATASKHMGLCRGHVGHMWLVWFIDYGGVNVGVSANARSYGCVNGFVHTGGEGPGA